MAVKLFLCILTLFSVSVRASERYGGDCGLIDLTDELPQYEIKGARKNLETGILTLSPLEKMQLIKTALALTDGERKIPSPARALSVLRQLIFKGLYSTKLEFNGHRFDLIMAFPGENPAGLIFKEGSAEPVAIVQDSDVKCVQ